MTPTTDSPIAGIGAKSLEPAMLRILDADGKPVGMGFLVTETVALTCAHVVAAALGAELAAHSAVTVDLALPPVAAGPAPKVTALVEPAPSSMGEQDLVLLRLTAQLPGSRPVRLVEVGQRDVWPHTARAFGLPGGRPGGVWHAGVLRAPQGDGLVQLDLDTAGAGYRVSRGFSGSPVWDNELSGVVGMVRVAESAQPPASFLIPTDTLLAAWPGLRASALLPSPFRSLTPFEEGDAAIFHGRHDESEAVANRVAGNSTWTTIVGPSGCGKSSLARAGVLPLRRAAGDCPVVVRPAEGASPLFALAAALLSLLEPGLSETQRFAKTPSFAGDLAEQGLRALVPRILGPRGCTRLLVVLDQFEELLDERLPASAVHALADVLFGESVPTTVRVLATLRADFLEAALAHPRLAPLVHKDNTYNLTPMSPEHLRESITKPVDGLPGVSYEPRLVERILADAGTELGALPLLGFTLDQLWHRQSGGLLTLGAYEELGAVTGALQAYAQKNWSDNVGANDETAGGKLLTQLVRVPIGASAATRRTTPRAELREEEWAIAQKLAGTRLLTINRNDDGTETVELAHEALITAWDKLAALVAADREYLAWRESLRHDLNRWTDSQRSPELLPTTVALKAAQRWRDERSTALSEPENSYLQRGRAYRRSRTRRRYASFTLVCVLVLTATTIGVISVRQHQDAARAAAVTRANNLAADAAALEPTDPGLAGQLAIAAYRTSPTQTAVNQLYTTLNTPLDSVVENTGNAVLQATTEADAVLQVATQDDGPLAAGMDHDGSLRIWNTANPAVPVLDATVHTAAASAIALAPHSALMAAACPAAKALCLWSLTDPRRPEAISQLSLDFGAHATNSVDSMSISADGTLLAAAGLNGQTFLWSIAQPAHPRQLTYVANPGQGAHGDLAAVAFAPHGNLLATTIQDGETELWNLTDPAHPSPVATINTGYQSVAFSPDGTLLAAAGDIDTGLWSLQNPGRPASVESDDECSPTTSGTLDFTTTAFSPDGSRLAFSGTDTDDAHGELCTLSLSTGNLYPGGSGLPTVTGTLTGFGTQSMSYTTSGALLTGGNDGTVRLWRWPLPQAQGVEPIDDPSWALSPSGHLMAAPIQSSQTTAPLGVWDLAAPGGPTLDATVPLTAQLQSVSFLSDTALLTVTHDGAVQLWNLRAPRHPAKAASLGNANFPVTEDGYILYSGVSSDTAGTLVAVEGSDNLLHLWRIDIDVHATEIGSIPATDTTANTAGFPGDGNTAIVTAKTGINWWDTADPAHPILTGTSPLSGVNQDTLISGGNTLAATTSEAGTSGAVSLTLFGFADGRVRSTVALSSSTGTTLGISTDGHLLAATGTAGNTITLWDTSDPGHPRNLATVLPGKDVTDVTDIVFDPSDRLMADWSNDLGADIVQLWDVSNPAAPILEYSLTNPDGNVSTAAFTPSGTAFALASGSSVFLYDTNPATLATRLCSYTGNSITPAQWQQDAPGIPYQNPCP